MANMSQEEMDRYLAKLKPRKFVWILEVYHTGYPTGLYGAFSSQRKARTFEAAAAHKDAAGCQLYFVSTKVPLNPTSFLGLPVDRKP